MKKLHLMAAFLLLNVFVNSQITDIYWQKLISDPSQFSTVCNSFDMYIHSTYPDSIPPDKLGNIKNYFRFVHFWKSRIGNIDDGISYKPYRDAIINLLTDPYCATRTLPIGN